LGLLNAQIITTIAGNGTNAYTGDGGQATSAELYAPVQLKFSAAGDLYFADWANNAIRKINTAGIISTIAGGNSTQSGFSGDGGQATNAKLSAPQAVTFDAAGNLYISDENNSRIRKVNTAGIITTIAGNGTIGFNGDGGQATAADINPKGMTFDAAGNLYIADFNNSRIRKINTAGIISTVAGTGTSGFSGDGGQATAAALRYPYDVVFDDAGNLYIADSYNNCIRKVNSAGIITAIAGNGNLGYSGDGGLATAAKLYQPTGMAFDASGNLYIADSFNNRIRKVNTAGIITTVAGTTTYGYNGDGIQATAAKLYYPIGVTLDASSCNLYIGDMDNYRIRKVSFPVVATASATTICAGATATLTASNATTYTWSTGADTSTILVNPSTTSNYTITGTNDGCISKAISTVNVIPNPVLIISGNSNICIGDNTTLIASGATSYIWSTQDTTASIFLKPIVSTTYTVTGTANACSSIATLTVNINSAFDFVLPNIVTPNNDNINDFIDFGKFQFSTLQIEIYNRFGTTIFESNNPTCIWKPTVDDGTYFYTAQYQINCNNEKQNKTLKGFVTVIR